MGDIAIGEMSGSGTEPTLPESGAMSAFKGEAVISTGQLSVSN
jgi:hypothetical protein